MAKTALPPGDADTPKDVTPVSPQFKLIFFSVMALTVASGVACVVLASQSKGDESKQLVETFSTTWKIGFGAIVGLIGGKSVKD